MFLIILLGSGLHFTFEWSGNQAIVGLFSAVNESVWEHLKLAFWPTLLLLIFQYPYLFKNTRNFFLAKTLGICTMILTIPIIFYGYTAFSGESIFIIDILSFIFAVIFGQLVSYKLLIYKKLSEKYNLISIIALIVLGIAFMVFTFYPPQLPLFQDPISGGYGIINHSH
jgi:hypothetical protein